MLGFSGRMTGSRIATGRFDRPALKFLPPGVRTFRGADARCLRASYTGSFVVVEQVARRGIRENPPGENLRADGE